MDPLLYIEHGLSYHYRKRWGRLLFIWSILFLSLTVLSLLMRLPPLYPFLFEVLFLLFLATYVANAIMKAAFLHLYEGRLNHGRGLTYESLLARDRGRFYKDDVAGFINSPYGDETFKRLGLKREVLEDYLQKRNFGTRISKERLEKEFMDLPAYALVLHDSDDHFASFLRNQRIIRDDLHHAARLVQNISAADKKRDIFWSKARSDEPVAFEDDVLNIEKAYNVYLTSPVLRKLAILDDEEKMKILRKVISNAKKESRRDVLISDIQPAKLGMVL